MRTEWRLDDRATFAQAGFKNGQQIYIANQDVAMNIEQKKIVKSQAEVMEEIAA